MSSENIPINGHVLWEKATKIALRQKIENFKASNGWLERFKKRHGITCNSSLNVFDNGTVLL
jgi:centromere protein B